jgi:hypothetical protein
MQKIVINSCYGGFSLSTEAMRMYKKEKKSKEETWAHNIERDDPILVGVVEKLGTKANDSYAKLKVVEIPDGVEWEIEEYDGIEWISEKHRRWE